MTTYGKFDIDSLPAPHDLELAAIDAERMVFYASARAEMERQMVGMQDSKRREMMGAKSPRDWVEDALSSLQCANEERESVHRDLSAEWYMQTRAEVLVSIALSLATLVENMQDIAADLRAIRLNG